MRPVGPFKPPYVLADDLQAMADEIARMGRISADGADVDTGAGGIQIRIPDAGRGIWAKVTAVGTAGVSGHKPYAWTQQRPAFDGSWEDDPAGLSGTTADDPAFEVTNKDTPTDGTAIIWLRRGYAGLDTGDVRKEWLFELGAGCRAPGGVGGTVTDHVTTVGTDCTTNQDIQTDWYFGCPIRVVTSVLGPADCCKTTMTYTVASTTRATVNGGASAVGTDGSTISFDVVPTTDATLAANSDALVPSQKAVKTYIDTAVTGLLDFKGATDASPNPNYPAASKGDAYVVSVAGRVGGASGKPVDVGDVYLATADNAGGTEAAVGASWSVLEHNLVGALLAANNLSDVASAAAALNNLLPSQAGANRKTLHSDGTGAGWSLVVLSTDVSGTLPDANLSSNVPLKSAANTFTAINTFAKVVQTPGGAGAVTTAGVFYDAQAATWTDSGTAASGTLAQAYFYRVGQPTLAAANTGVTTTEAATWHIDGPPVAGTNETITNGYVILTGSGLVKYGGARPITFDPATGNVTAQASVGSWSFRFGVMGSAGTDRGGFGFTGSSDVLSSWWIGLDQTHRGLTVTAGGEVVCNFDVTGDPAKVRHRVYASAGQSADMDQVLKDDGTTVYERVNKDGRRVIKKTSAPADADLNNSEMTWWCDDASGWPALKMKKSDGTVLNFGDCTQFLYDNTVTWNSTTCALTFTKTVKYLRGPILVNTTAC